MTGSRTLGAPAVIIGGGLVGCATAYYLAWRGLQPLVLERSIIGTEASGRSAGGVRAQCRDRRERHLAMASIKLWEGLDTELDFDTEYVQGGNIRLAATEERLAQLSAEAEEELADGLAVEVWDRDQLRQRAAYLSDTFIGAKYCATDGIANPILATWAFALAAERAGATLLTHAEAIGVGVQGGHVTSVQAQQRGADLIIETPLVIHAGGAWTPLISQVLGVQLPVVPARNFISVTQPMRPFFTEFVSSHDMRLYFRPARAGHVHLGGIALTSGTFDKGVPPEAFNFLSRIRLMVPALRNARLLRAWTGTLAMTPDGLPIIGPVDGVQGYILAAGFSGHGFCLGPIVGKLLSELIVDDQASLSLDELDPARFVNGDQHRDP